MKPETFRRLRAVMAMAVLASLGPAARAHRPGQAGNPGPQAAAGSFALDRYHTQQEIGAALAEIVRANPATAAIHRIARSAGGRDITAIEIGPEVGKKSRTQPAILLLANLEGTFPIASEAAVFLAHQVIAKAAANDRTWFIIPAGNPDAAERYFAKPLLADGRNGRANNDDMDDQADEDGPDDLDGNGMITEMRAKDPAGEWMPVEGDQRLMKRADPAKGEKGVYRLYVEGTDNDADGEFNEDGPGGTDISITFPHLFKAFAPNGGAWPGSEAETGGIIRFVMAHPEIGLTITLGSTNMCLQPPAGGRQGAVDLTRIQIPERFATALGVDPKATYTMQEVLEMVRPMAPPGFEITESMVASFLGLGAVVNPLEEDLKFYRELSERYKEFLKQAKLDAKRLESVQPRDGSFELWSYYHLGVPTFSMDFWTLPEAAEASQAEKSGITPESLEAMAPDAFVALGEAKIGAFLKEVGAPANIKPAMLIEGVKGGKMTPKMMAGMLKQMPKPKDTSGGDPKVKALLAFSDKELGGKGFVQWTPFKHPTLGEVEIGGMVPYADTTPPPGMLKALVEGQAPWVFTLANKMARLKILKTESAPKGAGVYEVSAWIQNTGALPFPTAMGKRNQRVPPAVVTLAGNGFTFLSGKKRTVVADVDATKSVKLRWLLLAEKPVEVSVALESANAWRDSVAVQLGGAR